MQTKLDVRKWLATALLAVHAGTFAADAPGGASAALVQASALAAQASSSGAAQSAASAAQSAASAAQSAASAAQSAASALQVARQTTAAASTPPPNVGILCAWVRDTPLEEKLTGGFGRREPVGATGIAAPARSLECGKDASQPRHLVGTGDVEVAVSSQVYEQITAYEQGSGNLLVLYINGVPLPHDGRLVGVERFARETHLRWRIDPGDDTQVLWASLYRDKGLVRTDSLRTAVGWRTSGPGISYVAPAAPPPASGLSIAISSPHQVAFAVAAMVLLLFAIFIVGNKTDALRDASMPSWYADAAALRAALKTATDKEKLLQGRDPAYAEARKAEYIGRANAALAGNAPENSGTVVPIGLALMEREMKPRGATFSLARVQMAMWFAFAVAAGLFLWIIYGELVRIDGSLLGLLMISVGTTAVSLGVDRNAGGRPYIRSQGLFLDLVTGFDDAHQVHRYQAVVVNLLLLFVGISHVLQQLAYPIFEPTWLGLLGVSGAALGLGKQVIENPGATEATPPKVPAAPAPTPAPASTAADGSVG